MENMLMRNAFFWSLAGLCVLLTELNTVTSGKSLSYNLIVWRTSKTKTIANILLWSASMIEIQTRGREASGAT